MRFNSKGGAPNPGNKNHEGKVFVDFWQKNVINARNQGKLISIHLTNIQTFLGWAFKAILGKVGGWALTSAWVLTTADPVI